ncbi:NAD(P)/FAD-dependent oxidoreductase [Streptomyces sp. UNOC14_S4]|uniref:flavin monoamine oxidase family protein n=1 Tax=Streptomyces sp. UNOC14_S4 TaxID=2872340 RepID=UPI001E2CB211|nr:NAD(P)/FAD-dependent oxidoreductase [Streptomyces sp. UNOC14_S4]MCC3770843.1 FAD-dependent oxidoreductase [Streptomyces sp. UNOC14_S4]
MTAENSPTATEAGAGAGRAVVTRRSVLRTAGFAALAFGAAAAGANSAHAASGTGSAEEGGAFDAIVIGAGFAGVTAARELRAQGLRPLILEARDRLGGRIWTDTFAGEQIELGGAWVSERHALVQKELQRYNIGLVTDPSAEVSIGPTTTGYRPFAPAEAGARQSALLGKLFAGAEEVFERPYEPLYRKDLLATYDRLSLRDRINELKLSAEDELWISGEPAAYSGGDSALGAWTNLAQWWALAGASPEGWFGLMGRRPVTGMTGLLKAILADAGADLRLNSPVAAIADDGRRVRVTTRAGKTFSAPVAVVAVPVNMWKTITFTPGLPAVHAAATAQGVGIHNSKKFWMRVQGATSRIAASGPEGSIVSTLLSRTQFANGEQLMIGFSADPGLDVTNRAQVQQAVRQMVPGLTVVDIKGQDWGNDKWSGGSWGFRKPGQLTAQYPAIQQPFGKLSFATDDIANGWSGGFIDGAIESGLRAAQQAVKSA